MIVRQLHFTFGKKETIVMKKFFVNGLVRKFRTCWRHELMRYGSTIMENVYKMQAQIDELEEGEVVIHVDCSENFKNKQQ